MNSDSPLRAIEQMDTDAFDLQEIKRVGKFWHFYYLLEAADIVIYLSFVIINGNLLKHAEITANILQL